MAQVTAQTTSDHKKRFSIADQFRIVRFLLQFAIKEWKSFALSLIAMALTSAVNAYLPLIVQNYIDGVLAVARASWSSAVRIASYYFLFILFKVIATYLKEYFFKTAGEKTVAHLRNRLYEKLGSLSMEYFNTTPNGTVVSRITNDTETIKEFWNVFLQVFDGLFNAIAIYLAMYSLAPRLSYIFLAFVPLVLLLIYAYQRVSTVIYGNMREALSQLNARLSESIMGMPTIQQFNQTDRMADEFDEVNQTYVTHRHNMFRLNALMLNPVISLMQNIALVIILVIFGRQVLGQEIIEVGILYAFVSYSGSFFNPVGMIMDSLSFYQDGLVAGSRSMRFLANDVTAPLSSPQAQAKDLTGRVELNDVSFSYDGDQLALNQVNLAADAGQMIGIVGHTGSGKSTLINLLMRFYDYDSGSIKLDGTEIRDISMDSLRDQIGIVLQDSFMFYGNIIDNIRLHGDYSDEEVIEAAKFSQANHFIEQLPAGYYQKVAEGGASMSTGQRQLISIARTILRDPKILILDEATANIDTETEQHIQESLANIRQQNRTMIVIAHRLSTIKDADQIYVLAKGKVIEHGSHDELIELAGTYYDMYRLQSLQAQVDN